MDAPAARRLFDANARTYDRVNSAISLGMDARWYDWAARWAVARPGVRVLDAFAGTGQVAIRAAEFGAQVTLADASPAMLDVARRRATARGLHIRAEVMDVTVPAERLPGPFDAITAMWGLRYVDRPAQALDTLAGMLAPGGRLIVVDFVVPSSGVVSRAAALYFFRVLPGVASILAGDRELYRELVRTVRAAGSREDLVETVREAGLRVVDERAMGFGLVIGLVIETDDLHA